MKLDKCTSDKNIQMPWQIAKFCVWLGFIFGIIGYETGLRLPLILYAFIAIVQFIILCRQVLLGNYLVSIIGFLQNSILFIAIIISLKATHGFGGMLISSVYTRPNVAAASSILLASSSLYFLIALKWAPGSVWQWAPGDDAELRIAKYLALSSFIMAMILIPLTSFGPLITLVPYGTSSARAVGGGPLSGSPGLMLLSGYTLILASVSSIRAWGISSKTVKLIIVVGCMLLFYYYTMRGNRAMTAGVAIVLLLVYLIMSRRDPWEKLILYITSCLAIIIWAQVWGYVRSYAASQGLMRAMIIGWRRGVENSFVKGMHPLRLQMLPGAYWHMLDIVMLYHEHVRLHGLSIMNLVPDMVPKFLEHMMRFHRPLSIPWILSHYMSNGGGMYVIAEGFWNYGFWGALGVAAFLALVAVGAERWIRQQVPLISGAYFAFILIVPYGMFYALQGLARGLETAVALSWLMAWGVNAAMAGSNRSEKRMQLRHDINHRMRIKSEI